MTTPNIDSILKAISASPGSGTTRSSPVADLFREHLQLQPYQPAPVADRPAEAPYDNGVRPSDGTRADDVKERRDDESTADAREPASTEEACIAEGCGVRTAELPQNEDEGEARAAGAEVKESAEAAGQKAQPRSENKGSELQGLRESIADRPSSSDPSAADGEGTQSTVPAKAKHSTDAAAVASGKAESAGQETPVVVSGESAVGEGEAEAELSTAAAAVVANSQKQLGRGAGPAKLEVKSHGESGERATGVKSTESSEAQPEAQPIAGPEDSADDDGRQRRGREKSTVGREALSPRIEPGADRLSPADTRISTLQPLPSAEPPPAAGEQISTAAQPPGESSSPSAAATHPTNVPAAATASSERLPTALGPSQTAERPSRSTLTEAQQARLVQRVAKAFDVAQGRGETTIRLRLSPPQLGSLRLEVQMESGVLTARLEVETHAARDALIDNLHALKQRLAEQNIRIENFDVDLTGRRQDGPAGREENSSAQQDRERQPSARRGRIADPNEHDGNRESETTRRSRLMEETNIDVTI